jgi:ABC transporter substrate binding protein (PQQ-dependent alcohol dehydrogenase system)
MQSRERKTIARPAHFGRKSIGKVPSFDFLVSAALLGAVVLLSAPLEAAPEQTETPSVQAPAAVAAAQAAEMIKVPIGYLKQEVKRPIPLSRLHVEPEDYGIAGALMALKDNNTTGRFTKQEFTLDVERVPIGGDAVAVLQRFVDSGHHFILVDAPADTLLALSDSVKGKDVLLFNVRAEDEELRQEQCRANVLHTAPDRYMLADALAQYLVWKRWQRWLVVKGVFPEDLAYLEAIRRAAKRFGGTIVEEREYKETPGARRSDTGQLQVQRQMPVLTQGAPSYDVVIVADEREVFGPYLPFRTYDPRPVAGTAGLVAASWHPAHEQWGATQMQNRFQRFAKRFMWSVDYQAWIAVRAIGEGTTRAASAEFAPVNAHIRSKDLSLAAFKGQKVTFRPWDGQMRQPILITGPDLPVSMSPQEGFLHEEAEVDTLGVDAPETKCKFK